MKSKNSLVIITTIFFFCILIFISIWSVGNYAGKYQRTIYDNNSKIIAKADSFSYLTKIGETNNTKSKLKFRFTGMDTIWILDCKEDTVIRLDYNCKITNGRFKAVLITPENEVVEIFTQSCLGNQDINIKKGKNRIKIVGDGSIGNLEIFLSYNNNLINVKSFN